MHNDAEGTLGQMIRPIARVGVYAPGGSAPLPSSVLMTAIPARVAGVEHLVLITPPQRATGLPHPAILVAADIAGVDAIFIAGGAQAIGALAFGTADRASRRQDLRTRQPLHHAGKAPGLRHCRHRRPARPDRDGRHRR